MTSNSGEAGQTDVRPWGSFVVIADLPYAKVKRLTVNPGHRFSYQSHKHRDEHWIVVRGVAQVTLNDVSANFKYGDHIFFARDTKHRLACVSDEAVEIIEVQVGESFGEDDIVRYEDDYGRTE
jgi:mannose-6-phosphate isomerase-like protein (cupin superfamily)